VSPPRPIRYLTAAEIVALHEMLMAHAGTHASLLDEGKIESVSLRPQNVAYYEGADLITQAASLIVGLALAHAFSDGNKRLAAFAGAVFLRRNGLTITAHPPAYAEQILAVVNRNDALAEATQRLIAWLRANTALFPATPGL
jgi:death-on-curing protein